MQRLSNRNISETQEPVVQYKYVEVASEPIIQTIEIPVERVIEIEKLVQMEADQIDLEPIKRDLNEIKKHILLESHKNVKDHTTVTTELEMQRRALVAIKTQRDIDRNRRLMLIRRMKKEKTAMLAAQKKDILILKLAMGASLLIAIVSLIVKL